MNDRYSFVTKKFHPNIKLSFKLTFQYKLGNEFPNTEVKDQNISKNCLKLNRGKLFLSSFLLYELF